MDRGQVLGFEALLRWNSLSLGSVPPEEFLPLAEDTGLIIELGNWALGQVCATLRGWHDAGFGQLRAALNLSAKQFHHEALIGDVQAMLRRYHLPAGALELELNESLIMEDVDRSLQLMSRLRKMGVRMTVDDFGTGYSSLAYLKKLPIDALKIDRSFVRDITTDRDDPVIVKAILSLALQLGLEVVAEGVETREQHDLLREEGCHRAQGFHYALPMAGADALEFVRQRAQPPRTGGSHLTVI